MADYTAVKLADAQAFYAQFIGGSSGELAIVGDFDPAEVNTLLVESIGNWKSPTPYVRVPQQVFDVKETNLTIETPDKANAFFISGKSLKLRDDDPDFAAMELANYIVGGGFLNSRLITQIRQKEGLSYFAGSQFYASPLDQYGQFIGLAIYAPENVAKLQAAYSAVIDSVLKNGFSADGSGTGEGWLPAVAAAFALAGQRTRPGAGAGCLPRPNAGVGCRPRGEGENPQPAAVAGGVPEVRRSDGLRDREGGRLREGEAGGLDALVTGRRLPAGRDRASARSLPLSSRRLSWRIS